MLEVPIEGVNLLLKMLYEVICSWLCCESQDTSEELGRPNMADFVLDYSAMMAVKNV